MAFTIIGNCPDLAAPCDQSRSDIAAFVARRLRRKTFSISVNVMNDHRTSSAAEYFGLDGTVALVTGASSGLGRHFAMTLAAAGCAVGVAARREDRLEDLAAGVGKLGGRALPIPMDVTDRKSVDGGLGLLSDTFGTPSVLVNNAGIAAYHGFLDAPADETSDVFAVNQSAAWNVSQMFAKRLAGNGAAGSIINISSITALRARKGAASYAVAKAAVAHMTSIQALELARHGIRANAIAPGYFETDLNREFLASEAGAKTVQRIPMRRTGRFEELDGLLLLLASNRSSFMTGAVIPVDGGHLVNGL